MHHSSSVEGEDHLAEERGVQSLKGEDQAPEINDDSVRRWKSQNGLGTSILSEQAEFS